MVSELPSVSEVSIAQLTVGVIPGHVQLPLLFLIEVGAAELALGMIHIYMGVELFSSVSGKLQRETAPSSLHIQAKC